MIPMAIFVGHKLLKLYDFGRRWLCRRFCWSGKFRERVCLASIYIYIYSTIFFAWSRMNNISACVCVMVRKLCDGSDIILVRKKFEWSSIVCKFVCMGDSRIETTFILFRNIPGIFFESISSKLNAHITHFNNLHGSTIRNFHFPIYRGFGCRNHNPFRCVVLCCWPKSSEHIAVQHNPKFKSYAKIIQQVCNNAWIITTHQNTLPVGFASHST